MLSKTTRSNLARLLRTELLVNATHAAAIVDGSFPVISGPIHDAVLLVDMFSQDGSGSYEVRVEGRGVGGGRLRAGDLDRWLASPAGLAAIAKRDAEDAAHEASVHKAKVVSLLPSIRFPGTAELTLDDGRVLPMIPVNDEDGDDLVALHDDLTPGAAVRMIVVNAGEIGDDFARTMPDDQPCVDFVMLDRAA